ncbi:MAG: RdgB/HAM1 family non-canonical purine NTP pyrophosphatase [Methanomicrobiaceae archaeon]|nr:RdgB/HAM1 family non-canonical purine NTP pyrophosphatase [Methanomicrobiaceae archaeon]
MKIAVVTSNPHKVAEVRSFFDSRVEIEHVPLECPEYRHDDVGEIAREKARWAYYKIKSPLIVDDTAFSIDALGGFPGPYAAYVLRTIGLRGILRLMEDNEDTHCFFETAIACAWSGGIQIFRGRVEGRIVAPRGDAGFGYDPIVEIEGKTLAERSLVEKTAISHRGKALRAFSEWASRTLFEI